MIIPSRFLRLTAAVAALSAFTLYAEDQQAEAPAAAEPNKTAAAAPASESGRPADAAEASRMNAEAAIQAEKREKTADEYYTMARNDFIEGSFRTSSEHSLKAIEILRDGKPASEDALQPKEVQDKIAAARTLLSKAYYNLALEMFVEAEKSMNANMYDEAIAKCNEAVAVDPDNEDIKAYSDALIKKFTRLKEATEYNAATSYYSKEVDEPAQERQLIIEREMRKGQQFYKTGQWAKARDHFQEVLLQDPYNEMAIDYLRRCFLHLIDTGRRRHNVVSLERYAETNWKSVQAIVTPANTDDEMKGGGETQAKADDTKNIEGKLKTIIIPHLDFEDQTLQDVIDVLRRRSRELDPDKHGVNILLFLSNKQKNADGEGGSDGESESGSSSSEEKEESSSSSSEEKEESAESDEKKSGDEKEEDSGSGSSDKASEGGRSKYMIDYLKVDNVDLLHAIGLVCEAAGVHCRVEPNAVLIYDDGVPLDECVLKVFVIEKDALDFLGGGDEGEGSSSSSSSSSSGDDKGGVAMDANSQAIKRFFELRGVPFPPNAAIKYDDAVSRLIVSNTPEALTMIGDILEQLSNEQTNQVLVQVKFVEVQLNDLEELGFEYVISRPTTGDRNVWDSAIALEPNVVTVNGVEVARPIANPYGDGRAYTLVYYPPTSGRGTTVLEGATVMDANTSYSLDQTAKIPANAQVTLPVNGTNSYYALPLNLTSIYGHSVTWGPNDPLVRNAADEISAYTNSVTSVQDTVMSWAHQDKDSGVNVSAKVHALDLADSSDILSAPRVTTLANEEAIIKMVTEKYYPDEWNEPTLETISKNGTNENIPVFVPSIPTFGDAVEEGIVLNVRPQVDDNFTITLYMTPVIQLFVGWTDYSYVMPLESNGVTKYYPNTLKKPIIEARTVETTVVSYDGETIVLGGVIKDRISMVDDQYPILGDIPLIGRLFQSKGRGSEKTSLLIFMTSRLIKPDGSPIRENEERGIPSFRY